MEFHFVLKLKLTEISNERNDIMEGNTSFSGNFFLVYIINDFEIIKKDEWN